MREFAAWAVVGLLALFTLGYFVLRIQQATVPLPFGDLQPIPEQEWQDGRKLLYPDQKCADQDARFAEIQKRRQALGRQAVADKTRPGALIVGKYAELPVIFFPCDGTYLVLQ